MSDGTKILIAGEVILDIAPAFLGDPVSRPEDCLIPGRALLMGECRVYAGAMGNTALAVKRLGGEPLLVGRTGKDLFGELLGRILDKEGVEYRFAIDWQANTPYTISLAVPGIDRMFLYHPDAAWRFTRTDVSDAMLKEAAILHFGYLTAMKNMFRDNAAQCRELFKRAKELGTVTSMDICFIDEREEGPHQDWNRILQNVCPYLDIFAPSAEELMYYIDRGNYEKLCKEAADREVIDILDVERDIGPLAGRLLEWGCCAVMVKCGTKGIYLRTGSAEKWKETADRLPVKAEEWTDLTLMQPAFPVEKVRSAAGAGDTTIAAFLMALLRGHGPKAALKLAAATGARCVQSYDSFSNLIRMEELEKETGTKTGQEWKQEQ